MKTYLILPLLAIALLFGFNSCEETDDRPQSVQDEEAITNFLEANNFTDRATRTEDGLYFVIDTPGTGASPNLSSTVIIHYTGTLVSDGTIFDSSYDNGQPATLALGNTIQGWQKGIPFFKRGAKGFLVIPSALAYGTSGNGSIPPNAVLLFEIHLIDFV